MNSEILRSLSYGMFSIGVKGEKNPSACISNTVFQVSAVPVIIAASINKDNYTNECIKRIGMFSVSVLSEDTSGAAIGALGFNSGRDTNKLKNLNYKMLEEGIPVIKENICCWMLCKVIDQLEIGTHTVFFAQILDGSDNYIRTPMTYSYYHRVIKGTAPKNSPTYKKDEENHSTDSYYVCSICGYVHSDPRFPFETLPDNWVCPVCGAPKSVFRKGVN